MDILVEKLDGSRYYLSQYKVLITDFEESAPSVTRNSKQLDQRNGNIDFGGWHTDKTINITGYYRADDIDEEETLREKLYALLSDPNGYYITQLKTTPSVAMERPGETSGGYYDKLSNYPSHKRFLVYTEAPEMELVGNVGGTLLYKLTAEFKTMKLPYGESVPRDLDVKPNVPYYGRNLLLDTKDINNLALWFANQSWTKQADKYNGLAVMQTTNDWGGISQYVKVKTGEVYTLSFYARYTSGTGSSNIYWSLNTDPESGHAKAQVSGVYKNVKLSEDWQQVSATTTITADGYIRPRIERTSNNSNVLQIAGMKLELGNMATDWSPALEDPDYNGWYLDTYYNTNNLFIPYAGTVPCNQLEQGFTIEMTAKEASSSLSFKINDTELAYSGAVADGDMFMFSGFSYTQNGLSIVSKTNKAYFILQPDKPNKITCNVPGTVRIIGLQNLYA